MKSYLLFAFSLILLGCSNNVDNTVVEPKSTLGQIRQKRMQHTNDSLLQLIANKGYQNYYSRALFYFKYHYFQCNCNNYDGKINPLDNARFILSKVVEKTDTIWYKTDRVVRLDFDIILNDTLQCFRLLNGTNGFTTGLAYGFSFSKKDTSLLAIYHSNNVMIPIIPNKKNMLQPALDRLGKFKKNREYADDTLNYLFEKYKNDSIIYY